MRFGYFKINEVDMSNKIEDHILIFGEFSSAASLLERVRVTSPHLTICIV